MRNQSSRQIVKDSFYYIPAKFFPAVAGLVAIPVLTRLLGTEEFGTYSLMRTTILMLNTLTTVWLVNATIRYYSRTESGGDWNKFYSAVCAGTAVSLIAASVGYLVIAGLVFESLKLRAAGFIVLAGLVLVSIAAGYLRSSTKARQFAVLNSLRAAGGLGAGLLILYVSSSNLIGFFAGEGLFYFILLVPVTAVVLKNKNWRWQTDIRLFKEMLLFGMPMAATSILAFLLISADQYMLKVMRGTVEVGLYAVPYTLADQGVRFLIQIIIFASTPIIFRVFDTEGEREASSLVYAVIKYFIILITPVLMLIKLFDKELLRIIATPAYAETSAVMTFVALGAFVHGITQILNNLFMMKQQTRVIMRNFLWALVLNVLLNILLIHGWGYQGAAVATLVSYLFLAAITYFSARSLVDMRVPTKVVRAGAIAMVMLAAVVAYSYFVDSLVWTGVYLAGSLVIYAVAILGFGITSVSEIKRFL